MPTSPFHNRVSQPPAMGSTVSGGMFTQYPLEVNVGGATVFVLEVSQFLKV